MKIYSNKELRRIPVFENDEKLVNPKKFSKRIIIELDSLSRRMQKLKNGECVVREGVAKRLGKAQRSLPVGYFLKIEWAYHPIEVQRKIYFNMKSKLKRQNPDWSERRIHNETEMLVAPPDIAPHATGGAIDLTLVNKRGKALDMGQRGKPYSKTTYTNSKNIPKEARNNRGILVRAMKNAGFVNYPVEWWHWSYGDRDWAITKRRKKAIYGPLEGFE